MERNNQRPDDELTVDLGEVTLETKGPGVAGIDFQGLEQIQNGLADD